jgi:NTE family protein
MKDRSAASGTQLSATTPGRVARMAFASIAATDPEPVHMPSRYLLLAICAVTLAWPSAALRADDDVPATDGERPRIGLVLSGGGARGAAHVGVIRALEQMRIPIDAVAGTSMGAVVGGLYAAGLSGDEI